MIIFTQEIREINDFDRSIKVAHNFFVVWRDERVFVLPENFDESSIKNIPKSIVNKSIVDEMDQSFQIPNDIVKNHLYVPDLYLYALIKYDHLSLIKKINGLFLSQDNKLM